MRNPGPQVAGGLSLLNKFLVKSAPLTYTFVKTDPLFEVIPNSASTFYQAQNGMTGDVRKSPTHTNVSHVCTRFVR